ncbi:MAG: hypothetical protein ABIR24_04845 [Verrucomicrobiota bacterium]
MTPGTHSKTALQPLLTGWILFSAFCVATGWILSAIHQLNILGYGVAFAVLLIAYFSQRKNSERNFRFKLRLRRFRRPLPAIYLFLAILALLGGAIYAPTNYDALTYRFPRVLHWWAAEQWHWFDTADFRMNSPAVGMEWLMTPLFTFARSDRFFFLTNIVSYLLLPGLIFSVFRQMGVAARVAWNWMWLLPSAFCYVMQAGSIGNDSFAAVYFLASIYYSLKARRTNDVKFLWLAILSAALLTGAKISNLPLLLPCVVAAWPAGRLARVKKFATCGVFFLALLISFLPSAILNQRFSGRWDGNPGNISKVQVTNPVAAIAGNTILLASQSLMPPLLPKARPLENWLENRLPKSLREMLQRDFPRFDIGLGELPQEEGSGLGLGITMMILLSICAPVIFRNYYRHSGKLFRNLGGAILAATWIAFLFYMIKTGSEATARLIAPYYPLLLATALIHPANALLVRRRWWKVLAVLCAMSPLAGLILTPSRPLVPAEHFFVWMGNRTSNHERWDRPREIYAVYRQRNDLLAPLRNYLPPEAKSIGLVAGVDDTEVALWRPFGQRRVIHLMEEEIFDRGKNSSSEWIVVNSGALKTLDLLSLKKQVGERGGQIIGEESIISRWSSGPSVWLVLYFPSRS